MWPKALWQRLKGAVGSSGARIDAELQLDVWRTVPGLDQAFVTPTGGVLYLVNGWRDILNSDLEPLSLEGGPAGPFHFAQQLPSGEYVLARARAEPGVPNAFVFRSDGAFSHAFAIGDGVAHICADGLGKLWVGYFDEGVFGSDPLSRRGLNRFASSGELEFGAGNAGIYDCYALTADQNGCVWFYAYPDFNVGRVDDDRWTPVLQPAPASGAQGLLASRGWIALFGSYDCSSLVTLVGSDGVSRRLQLVDERHAALAGRGFTSFGDDMLCHVGERVYRVTMGDLLAALGADTTG